MELSKIIIKYPIVNKTVSLILDIFFISIRKIMKPFANYSGNIIIIAFCKLGDTVFTIPAIQAIKNYYKKNIIIVCYPESVPIYNLALYNIRYIQIHHKHFLFGDRLADYYARKKFAELQPEIIFDLNGVMTSATLIFNSRAKTIIGMSRQQFRGIYDHHLPIDRRRHLRNLYLKTVSLVIPKIDIYSMNGFPKKTNVHGKILIHPFASWQAKEWNLAKFIKLAEKLNEHYNVAIIMESGIISKDVLIFLKEKQIDYFETKSVDELVQHIKECSVLFGNDSGPAHIADLLGKPTFNIYGPTNPKFCSPIGEHHAKIYQNLRCSPRSTEEFCFTNAGRNGCPSYECMNTLSFEIVLKKAEEFLNLNQIPKLNRN